MATTKRRREALSAAFVRTVNEVGTYSDGNGLNLRVEKSGTKRWIQRVTIDGARRNLGLGSYPAVSLADARKAAWTNATMIGEGRDPIDRGMVPRPKKNITFCADGGPRLPAQRFGPDTAWVGCGTAFSASCTLLVVWYSEQEEPWIILTDLAPDKVGPSWYPSASGSNWASRPSRASGSGTRPAQPNSSPATGWCCRWPPCWPWPTHQGGRRPRPQHRPWQPAGASQGAGS